MVEFWHRMKAAAALFFGFAFASWSWADEQEFPRDWQVTSNHGRYLFKMVAPDWEIREGKSVMVREPYGVAYSRDKDGELKELWRTEGWHDPSGFLSEDGRYLVSIGPWATDQQNHTDRAIAFHDRGKLLKAYRVCDLLRDASAAQNSVWHYRWRPEIQTEPTGLKNGAFHLVMIDKTAYTFDIVTGKVLSTTVDTGAKSQDEIIQQYEERAAENGKRLYVTSSFREDYDKHFIVTGMAGGRKTSRAWFEEPEWSACMAPRKKYPLPCGVDAVFPIGKSGQIEASIMPAEIDAAFLAALEHPFVKACFEKKQPSDFYLHITGDRLHQHTETVQKCLAQVLPGASTPEALGPWAEFQFTSAELVDASLLPPSTEFPLPHKVITVFLNIQTRQLIYEDDSKWPWVPVLLDAKGVRVSKP